jgi:selenocysteine-specific elongation factor
MHVVGTAGHVDHGKSALVRALTGTDPDRWLEERVRGMTLDLGFARLRYDDGLEAGIVDVPGHERFLHNMLAGAAGMEMLLLVVAADEGPRPQTHEHLAILQYLNVRRTLIVLTKVDLLGAEELTFAQALVRDGLSGTLADGAPIFPVSSVTGAGLEELREAIHAGLRALPPRAPDAPAYLPIDRVFALPGHGTIVTGTLMQGEIALGDRLQLTPLGREVRVRSLHVFGEARERVAGGARLALNFPGVETTELARGAVVASPQLEPRSDFAVRFRPLASALGALRRRTPVRAYLGSAELLGTLVFERTPTSADECGAVLHLREATIGIPGATFVLRRMSPKDVLGGGTLLAPGDVRLAATTGALRESVESSALLGALVDAGLAGSSAERLGAAANLRVELAQAALERFVSDGRALRLEKPAAYVDGRLADEFGALVLEQLRANEAARPWMSGLTTLGLSRALGVLEATAARLLGALVEDGRFEHRSGYFVTHGFAPRLSAEQRHFFDLEFPSSSAGSNLPVDFERLRPKLRAKEIEGLSQAFDMLLASGALVKIGDAVYRRSQVARIRKALEATLREKGRLAMSEFRDLIGTSRKYAVPLLEWFDATGVTLRSGDFRVLREPTDVSPGS